MSATLLLADDSITIQRVIELTFANEGVRVVAVGDGQAAVQRIDAERPDIVLADVGMPKLDGYAVARHIKQSAALNAIPVLLLTGAFEPVDEDQARASGCDGILVKPIEPRQLIARVKELLAGRHSPELWPAILPRVESSATHAPQAAVPPPSPPAAEPAMAAGSFDELEIDDQLKSTLDELEPDVAEPVLGAPADDLTRELERLRGSVEDTPDAERAFGNWDIPKVSARQEESLELEAEGLELGAPLPPPKPASSAPTPASDVPAVSTASAPAPGTPAGPAKPRLFQSPLATSTPGAAPSSRRTLASAFSALLAAEEAAPALQTPLVAAAVSEAAVEEIVERVVTRMTQDTVRRLVLETAERLIREEIEKIKGGE